MSKIDTKELEKLRKSCEESYSEVYKLVTLVTCGDEGRSTVMDKVKAHGDANKALAAYEATHKGVVKKLDGRKVKYKMQIQPRYMNYLNQLWGEQENLYSKPRKSKAKLKKKSKVKS